MRAAVGLSGGMVQLRVQESVESLKQSHVMNTSVIQMFRTGYVRAFADPHFRDNAILVSRAAVEAMIALDCRVHF